LRVQYVYERGVGIQAAQTGRLSFCVVNVDAGAAGKGIDTAAEAKPLT
jgi:hypothetical protein